MGVLFFSISIGMALAPAVQGSAMNIQYKSSLSASLPEALTQAEDNETMELLSDSRALLSPAAMDTLRRTIAQKGDGSPALFDQTVEAIRSSLESGLKVVFLMSAISLVLSFILILTIPIIPMDRPVEENKASEPIAA
jgi:hypothetical protein